MVPIEKSAKGQTGMATVRVAKGKVKVTFEGETKIHDLFVEDAPEGITDGKYVVGMNADYTQIMFVNPPDGQHVVKFIGFARDQDGNIAMPRLVKGGEKRKDDKGRTYTTTDHFMCSAVYEITDGEYKGWTVRKFLPYAWKDFDGEAGIAGTGKMRLVEWLEKMGMDLAATRISYSDNVLPVLEGLLKPKKTTYLIEIKDGFVNGVSKVPDVLLKGRDEQIEEDLKKLAKEADEEAEE